jgi:hypothetical protein
LFKGKTNKKNCYKKFFSNQKWFLTFATENQEEKFGLIATSDLNHLSVKKMLKQKFSPLVLL